MLVQPKGKTKLANTNLIYLAFVPTTNETVVYQRLGG